MRWGQDYVQALVFFGDAGSFWPSIKSEGDKCAPDFFQCMLALAVELKKDLQAVGPVSGDAKTPTRRDRTMREASSSCAAPVEDAVPSSSYATDEGGPLSQARAGGFAKQAPSPQLPAPQLPVPAPQLAAPQLPAPQLPAPELPVPQLPAPAAPRKSNWRRLAEESPNESEEPQAPLVEKAGSPGRKPPLPSSEEVVDPAALAERRQSIGRVLDHFRRMSLLEDEVEPVLSPTRVGVGARA